MFGLVVLLMIADTTASAVLKRKSLHAHFTYEVYSCSVNVVLFTTALLFGMIHGWAAAGAVLYMISQFWGAGHAHQQRMRIEAGLEPISYSKKEVQE